MECLHMRGGRDRHGLPCQFRCGQCTGCRVLKQSSWMLRNLMEYARSTSGQLLTLTVAPEHYRPDLDGAKLIKNFFNALRMRDRRAFGTSPVRYFGCLEYGGTLGRAHYHFLIYNAEIHFSMEQGLTATELWPHGHIHLGSYRKASVRYVTAYLMERDWQGNRPRPFMSRRPGIGFSSLRQLGASLARTRPYLSEIPSALILGQRTYPLDRTAKGYLLSGFLKGGGVFETPSADELIRRRLERIYLQELRTPEEDLRAIRYRVEQEAKEEKANGEAAEKFFQVYEKARRFAQARDPDGAIPPGPHLEVPTGTYPEPPGSWDEGDQGLGDTPF